MSKIEELIAKYCPDGVEYVKLGDVCEFITGFAFKASLFKQDGEPICKTTNIQKDSIDFSQMEYFHLDDYDTCLDKYIIMPQDIVIGMSGTIKIGINSSLNKCYLNQRVGKFIPHLECLNNKFLYYILLNNIDKLCEGIIGGSVKNLSNNDVNNLEIPLPPLPIQEEIVRILDTFTELQARQQQYQYYRDQLLSFEGRSDVEWKKLGEVAKSHCSGSTPTKSNKAYYENGTIPWLRTQDVKFNEITEIDSYITEMAVKETSVKWIPENCVIVAISGATAGRSAINKIRTTTNQHCLNIEIDSQKALYKYVFYCVCNQYDELISLKQGARGDLNSSMVLNMKIPIPSLSEQQKIVDILDRFDTLVNDLSQGLPAEIEARKQQYEYYRDQLLSFKRKA